MITLKTKLLLTLLIISTLATTIAQAKATTTDTLQITNLTNQTYTYTMQQIKEMPKTNVFADLYCYSTLLTNGTWGGVQLSYLLNQTGASGNINSIEFIAADSYTVSIPIQVAEAPQTIIAYEKDDQPLSEGLRLVLPSVNGASWIAQIVSMTMSESEASLPPMNAGMEKDVLTNLNDYGTMLETQPTTPTPSPTPTQTPTPNPTLSTPIPRPTSTSSQPAETSIKEETTDHLLPLTAILILAIILVISVYTWRQNNRRKSRNMDYP